MSCKRRFCLSRTGVTLRLIPGRIGWEKVWVALVYVDEVADFLLARDLFQGLYERSATRIVVTSLAHGTAHKYVTLDCLLAALFVPIGLLPTVLCS